MSNAGAWYMAIGGHQVGPIDAAEILASIRNGSAEGATLVFGPGMKDWTPLAGVPEFAAHLGSGGRPALPPQAPGRMAHDIDFRIEGAEMQYVEVELDPGEAAIAEAGTMMYMTQGIGMETIFGDGSKPRGGSSTRCSGPANA